MTPVIDLLHEQNEIDVFTIAADVGTLGEKPIGVAVLAGAAVVVIGGWLELPATATTIAGALLCFGLRLMAIRRGWRLPLARRPERPADKGRSADDDRM